VKPAAAVGYTPLSADRPGAPAVPAAPGRPSQAKEARLASIPLAFREYGKGPALVIVHGLFGSGRNWHTIANRLADRFRVFTVDLRNHGDSPWTPTMGLSEMADDLSRFIDDRQLATATVIGHSLGGKTAMLAALSDPARIEALVVVDIAPVRYRHAFQAEIDAMAGLDLLHVVRRAEAADALAARLGDPSLARFLVQNLATGPKGLVWKLNLAAIGRAMTELTDFPYVADWAFDGRTLFVSGDRSDYIDRSHDRQIFALFPQAEFAVIAGAGHRVHVDQPDAFLARLEDFLDSGSA
jgi:pimeloyl-ACP methyl ester carboxylesterase